MTQITTTGKAHELITFSRASSGTALRKIGYGSELVTNGTFDTDISGWSGVRDGVISYDSGRLKLVSGATTYPAAVQDISSGLIEGRTYELQVTVTSPTSKKARAFIGDSVASTAYSDQVLVLQNTTETVTIIFVASAAAASSGHVVVGIDFGAVSGDIAYFDNISVKEVLFDQPDGTLTLFNHFADIPRIEYNADGTVKGLLIEEQRTNLLTYSEDFTQSLYVKDSGVSITSSNNLSPSGRNTATLVTVTDNGRLYANNTSVTGVVSVFIKAGTFSHFKIKGNAVDLIAKTASEGTLEELPNGWFRYTSEEDTLARFFQVQAYPNESYLTHSDTGTYYIWGAQLEAGSFPTSYIPTSGATATRSPDIASVPVSAFGYNQNEGTVVVEFDSNGSDGADYPRVFVLSNTSGTDLTRFLINPTNTTTVAVIKSASGVALTGWSGSISENVVETVAVAIKKDSFAASLSGAATQTDTSGDVPAAADFLAIGAQSSLSSNYLNGHIKSIQYYPVRLADTQLQEITS